MQTDPLKFIDVIPILWDVLHGVRFSGNLEIHPQLYSEELAAQEVLPVVPQLGTDYNFTTLINRDKYVILQLFYNDFCLKYCI